MVEQTGQLVRIAEVTTDPVDLAPKCVGVRRSKGIAVLGEHLVPSFDGLTHGLVADVPHGPGNQNTHGLITI